MPRRSISYPARPHATGQARVKLGGKEFYLGKHGTPESRVRFYRLLAEYTASGVVAAGEAAAGPAASVDELLAAFWEWANVRYVKNGRPTSEIALYKLALSPVSDLYGELAASDFGPKALIACRAVLVAAKYSRKKINQHVGRIRRVWKWGVSREIVSASTWQALTAVDGLRKGEATEHPPVECVPAADVAAVEGRVLPPVWAMVQLQLATGMRPGEVAMMRTRDVTASGECWIYQPSSHKTEHHERTRVILLGPRAQEILRAWLRPAAPDAYLFSPREAVTFAKRRISQKAKQAVTVFGKPLRARYSVRAYSKAIDRACVAAGVLRWSPNQLRHNAATLIRKLYGVEVARVILGHATTCTTELYAERDMEKAVSVMLTIG